MSNDEFACASSIVTFSFSLDSSRVITSAPSGILNSNTLSGTPVFISIFLNSIVLTSLLSLSYISILSGIQVTLSTQNIVSSWKKCSPVSLGIISITYVLCPSIISDPRKDISLLFSTSAMNAIWSISDGWPVSGISIVMTWFSVGSYIHSVLPSETIICPAISAGCIYSTRIIFGFLLICFISIIVDSPKLYELL